MNWDQGDTEEIRKALKRLGNEAMEFDNLKLNIFHSSVQHMNYRHGAYGYSNQVY